MCTTLYIIGVFNLRHAVVWGEVYVNHVNGSDDDQGLQPLQITNGDWVVQPLGHAVLWVVHPPSLLNPRPRSMYIEDLGYGE